MCDMKFKDEIWLEIHVETHFNNNQNKKQSDDDEIEMLGASAPVEILNRPKTSRANSASSLTANVDENFEIDQMIILSEATTTNTSDVMIVDEENDNNGKFVRLLFFR